MSERNPSKQKRAARNKANRQALANRKIAAREKPARPVSELVEPEEAPRPSRRRRNTSKASSARPSRSVTPAGKGTDGRPSRTGGAAQKGPIAKGPKVKGTDGRPARTADAVPARRASNPVSQAIADVQAVPGGKGVFFALLFSIVSAGLILFTRVAPQEVMRVPAALVNTYRQANGLAIPEGLADKKAQFSSDYALVVFGPIAIAIALIPVFITAGVFAIARRENRRRNFTAGAAAMFLFVIGLAGPLSIYFLFSFGGLVWAAYKVRQAEPAPARQSAGGTPWSRRRSAQAETDEDDAEDLGD